MVDRDRVTKLLTDTITLLCKNGLTYDHELKVQGLLAITLDTSDVFIVQMNEVLNDSNRNGCTRERAASAASSNSDKPTSQKRVVTSKKNDEFVDLTRITETPFTDSALSHEHPGISLALNSSIYTSTSPLRGPAMTLHPRTRNRNTAIGSCWMGPGQMMDLSGAGRFAGAPNQNFNFRNEAVPVLGNLQALTDCWHGGVGVRQMTPFGFCSPSLPANKTISSGHRKSYGSLRLPISRNFGLSHSPRAAGVCHNTGQRGLERVQHFGELAQFPGGTGSSNDIHFRAPSNFAHHRIATMPPPPERQCGGGVLPSNISIELTGLQPQDLDKKANQTNNISLNLTGEISRKERHSSSLDRHANNLFVTLPPVKSYGSLVNELNRDGPLDSAGSLGQGHFHGVKERNTQLYHNISESSFHNSTNFVELDSSALTLHGVVTIEPDDTDPGASEVILSGYEPMDIKVAVSSVHSRPETCALPQVSQEMIYQSKDNKTMTAAIEVSVSDGFLQESSVTEVETESRPIGEVTAQEKVDILPPVLTLEEPFWFNNTCISESEEMRNQGSSLESTGVLNPKEKDNTVYSVGDYSVSSTIATVSGGSVKQIDGASLPSGCSSSVSHLFESVCHTEVSNLPVLVSNNPDILASDNYTATSDLPAFASFCPTLASNLPNVALDCSTSKNTLGCPSEIADIGPSDESISPSDTGNFSCKIQGCTTRCKIASDLAFHYSYQHPELLVNVSLPKGHSAVRKRKHSGGANPYAKSLRPSTTSKREYSEQTRGLQDLSLVKPSASMRKYIRHKPRHFVCHHDGCQKKYSSDKRLTNHIRLQHPKYVSASEVIKKKTFPSDVMTDGEMNSSNCISNDNLEIVDSSGKCVSSSTNDCHNCDSSGTNLNLVDVQGNLVHLESNTACGDISLVTDSATE